MNKLTSLILIAVLGILSIIIPVFIIDLKPYDSPLFPILRTGIEGINLYSLFFFISSGFIVKLFSKTPGWLIALVSMSLFPLAAMCEIIVDPTSHSLFPLEFIVYGIYSIPVMIGAYSAVLIKFIIKKVLKN